MIKKSNILQLTALFLSLSLLFLSCGGAEVKEENTDKDQNNQTEETAQDRSMVMDQTNQALADLTYSPYGKGFNYKNTQVPRDDFQSWLEKFKPQLQKAIDAVDQGFVLQVTGHTCSIGPREAQPDLNKKGNIYYSEQRAKHVYDALIEAGLPAAAMNVVGIADDEPLPGIDTKDQRNRRVTFKLVEKKSEGDQK